VWKVGSEIRHEKDHKEQGHGLDYMDIYPKIDPKGNANSHNTTGITETRDQGSGRGRTGKSSTYWIHCGGCT